MQQSTGNSQPDAIPVIVDWANAHDLVRAVLLTSTRAIPGAFVDDLSDYDVILVLQDIRPLFTDHSWLDDFGQVLIAYWDPVHPDPDYGIDHCSNVVQYDNGLKIDFTLWPVSLLHKVAMAPILPAELDAGYRILLDKDQLTDEIPAPSGKAYVPKPPTREAFQLLVNDFLSDAPFVAKCLRRDELMPAKWCLDYDMKYVYLLPMLEWLVEIDQDWSIQAGFLGKGLKKRLPADIWLALEQTYAGAAIEANWLALDRTMELFRQVSIQVGDALGYSYPEDLHEGVRALVTSIRYPMDGIG